VSSRAATAACCGAAALAAAAGGAGFSAAGAAAGAAAAAPPAAGCSPASPMRVTTFDTATVSPSLLRISSTTPAAGLGISASTLSVEISNSGWSRSTLSPTLTSHLVIVPSAIDSPIWGMTTSVAILDSLLELEVDRRAVGRVGRLGHRFAQRRVRVNSAEELLGGGLEAECRARLADQVGGVHADD